MDESFLYMYPISNYSCSMCMFDLRFYIADVELFSKEMGERKER